MEMLVNLISGKNAEELRSFGTKLIVRGSTAKKGVPRKEMKETVDNFPFLIRIKEKVYHTSAEEANTRKENQNDNA